MSGFSSDWLRLREPADHAARDIRLTERLAGWMADRPGNAVVDLGCGTGSNLRYLSPWLGQRQDWQLIDHDRELLDTLPLHLAEWAARHDHHSAGTTDGLTIDGNGFSASVATRHLDLATDLEAIRLDDTTLVTGSALLDLTSAAWMERLASRCHEHNCALLFVLSYDGRTHWHPADPSDERLRTELNRHQQQDKGLGPAMGPHAGSHVAALLEQHGFQVLTQPSDWQLDHHQLALQRELASGWARAILELDSTIRTDVQRWLTARLAAIDAGTSQLSVGHIDVLALPA